MIRYYANTKTKKLLCASLIGLLGIFLYSLPLGSLLEEKFGLDWLFKTRGAIAPPDNVAVVSIDKLSAEKLNIDLSTVGWPRDISKWPRDKHAQLINDLSQAGAKLIIFDLIFNTNCHQFGGNEKLVAAMRKFDNVVLIERINREEIKSSANLSGHPSHEIIEETMGQLEEELIHAAKTQTSFTLPKVDQIRNYWLFREGSGETPTAPVVLSQLLAFSAYDQFVRLMIEVDASVASKLPERINSENLNDVILDLRILFMEDRELSVKMLQKLNADNSITHSNKRIIKALLDIYSGESKRYLNFYGPPRTIKTIPYYKALQENQKLEPQSLEDSVDFKDKIVFVGFSATTQNEQDLGRDDYHTVFSNPNGLNISGVEIMATAFANFYEHKPINTFHFSANWLILFVFGLIVSMIFLLSDKHLSLNSIIFTGASSILVTLLYLFGCYYIFSEMAVWLPVIIPVLQLIFAFFITQVLKHIDASTKNRELESQVKDLKELFGSTFPNAEFEEIIGKEKNEQGIYGCCLNTDIEGYSTLAEPMDPRALRQLIEQYRNVLKEPVHRHHGHVVDMIGDSMLALWVANPEDPQSRIKACRASLEIAMAVEQFNQHRPEGMPKLPTRFGLHFGELSLSRDQGSYSIAGDVVNATNRIQDSNKKFKTRILASNEVIDGLDDFLIRPLGECRLRGKVNPVNLFELLADKSSATEKQQ